MKNTFNIMSHKIISRAICRIGKSAMPLFAAFAMMPVSCNTQDGYDSGPFLVQKQDRDSVLIADHLDYGFVLEGIQEGTGLSLPDYSAGFRDSVVIVENWRVDTLGYRKGKGGSPAVMDLKSSVVVTSFDEGSYELPALSAVLTYSGGKTDTVRFKPLRLEVKPVPVDTATFEPKALKSQINYPVTAGEVAPYAGGGILLLLLAVLAVWLVKKYARKKTEELERKDPAHITALRKLDSLKGDKLWAPDKQKIFYSEVTDALREYMAARYDFGAMEMTTPEILDMLRKQSLPEGLYDDMKDLFGRSDFVKFAKYTASETENAGAVPAAVRFVTMTYQTDLENESGKEGQNKG